MREPIFGKTLSQLEAIASQRGLPRYAARQIAGWLYGRHAESFESMTNLAASVRRELGQSFEIDVHPPLQESVSADGTKKYLFAAARGRFVEAAYIPEARRGTLCLSTQIGCRMGCLFCMTGRQGFSGNLSPGQILNQYRSLPERGEVTHVVYMGMGEPLDNLEAVLASLQILCGPWGYDMSPRKVTVSTIGLLPALETFLRETPCRLSVSLHSPFEEERRSIMPVEGTHPLKEVLKAIRAHSSDNRRVSFEYIVLKGLNHSASHARELARILQGMRCRVNLIPFHPIPGSPLSPCTREQMEEFQSLLKDKGILTTVRRSRGLDIQAACGLLSTRRLQEQRGAG